MSGGCKHARRLNLHSKTLENKKYTYLGEGGVSSLNLGGLCQNFTVLLFFCFQKRSDQCLWLIKGCTMYPPIHCQSVATASLQTTNSTRADTARSIMYMYRQHNHRFLTQSKMISNPESRCLTASGWARDELHRSPTTLYQRIRRSLYSLGQLQLILHFCGFSRKYAHPLNHIPPSRPLAGWPWVSLVSERAAVIGLEIRKYRLRYYRRRILNLHRFGTFLAK